jgi:uncharacterized protein with ATP-grasp and redox domains
MKAHLDCVVCQQRQALVISKGQANYEIMSALQGLYFLLIAKYAIVAEDSETYKGAFIWWIRSIAAPRS